MEPDPFIGLVTDWRTIAAVVALIVAIAEARVRLQRLNNMHTPERMEADAIRKGQNDANFKTAQEDIKSLDARIGNAKEKERQDVIALHAKVEQVERDLTAKIERLLHSGQSGNGDD